MNRELRHAVVTGAGGFIGRTLVEGLCRRGVEVVAISRHACDLPCRCVPGDIEKPFLLDEFLTPETTVFHLAAHASVAGSVRDPRYDFNVNMAGFLEVLESVRLAGASLVFPSSASVFDPRQPLPHAETACKLPSSPYAAAKLAGESYCQAYHRCYGLDVKIARLFNVYGPGMTRFAIYDFYRKTCEAETHLEILGDGTQTRDYLYIDDAVEGLITIAERGESGEDYNLASGVPTTSLELARLMLELLGKTDLEITFAQTTFPGDVPQWYADIDKMRRLGFQVSVNLRRGLERTLAGLQQPLAANLERR